MDFSNIRTVKGGELADVAFGGVVITLYSSHGFNDGNESFRPQKITVNGKQVWWFGDEKFFGTKNEFHMIGETPVIIRIKKDEVVEFILPSDLGTQQQIRVASKIMTIGGRSAEESLALKDAISKKLGVKVVLNEEELTILKKREAVASEAAKKVLDQFRAEKDAERAKKEIERKRIVSEIMSRKPIEVWTENGARRGIPVAKDEWVKLDGVHVVLTDNGNPVEYFFVEKIGAKTNKKGRALVCEKKEDVVDVEAIEVISVTIGDETNKGVPVFKDMAAIHKLRSRGLNHGTWVAIPENGNMNRLQVMAVREKSLDPIKVVRRA